MWYLMACRGCLATEGKLEKIDAKIRRIFSAATDLKIEEGDGFPQYLCAECFTYIKKTIAFRRRSRRAHYVLQEIHSIRKQVTQDDILTVDRVKTNLISPFSYWHPENCVAFSYSTLDAIENVKKDEMTSELQTALKDSLLEHTKAEGVKALYDLNVKYDEEGKMFNLEIKPLESKAKRNFRSTIFQTNGEFIKHELNSIKTSTLLVDIKPANYKEIEKEEEEKRQREIEEAMMEIHGEDGNCDNDADFDNENEIPKEEIDLEDVFKGLKEESEEESESEDEMDIKNKKKTPKKTPKGLHTKIIDALPYYKKVKLSKALANSKIEFQSFEEQVEAFLDRLRIPAFRLARFKCAMCVTVYEDMPALEKHMAYHNSKMQYNYPCRVCKDRFETELELNQHSAECHWYRYHCGICSDNHFSLHRILYCYEKHQSDEKIKQTLENSEVKHSKKEEYLQYYKRRPLCHEDMYGTLSAWSGSKGHYTCDQCKLGFADIKTMDAHRRLHQPPVKKHSNDVRYQCDICHVYLKSLLVLGKHMQSWHLYSYTCKLCRLQLRNSYQAKYHFQMRHQLKEKEKKREEMKENDSTTASAKTVHYCSLCKFSGKQLEHLYCHQLVDHGYIRLNSIPELNDSRFYCESCKIYFADETSLFHHVVKEKHEVMIDFEKACVSCIQIFETKEALQEHLPTCSRSTYPRVCEYCGDVQQTWKQYAKHYYEKKHYKLQYRGADSRLCEICGKVVSKTSMATHKRIHETNSSQYIFCKFCPTRSMTVTNHISHILFNHTFKPYCCTLCGLRFKNRCECRDHILKSHAPVRPYSCEACNRHFSHLDYLNEHCRKVHNVDLKKTDKSVYLPKRMFGKIYVYPHMKIDGTLIDEDILAKAIIEICDYMEENNRVVDYKDYIFIDHTIDPIVPTKKETKKKKKSTYTKSSYEKKKLRRAQKRAEKMEEEKAKEEVVNYDFLGNVIQASQCLDSVEIENVILSDIGNTGNENEVTEDNVMEIVSQEEFFIGEQTRFEAEEIEQQATEDVVGELIEQNGEYFVIVDGVLYKLENK